MGEGNPNESNGVKRRESGDPDCVEYRERVIWGPLEIIEIQGK